MMKLAHQREKREVKKMVSLPPAPGLKDGAISRTQKILLGKITYGVFVVVVC